MSKKNHARLLCLIVWVIACQGTSSPDLRKTFNPPASSLGTILQQTQTRQAFRIRLAQPEESLWYQETLEVTRRRINTTFRREPLDPKSDFAKFLAQQAEESIPYIQQMGLKNPTYLAILTPSEDSILSRELIRETVLSGALWHESVEANILMDFRGPSLQIFKNNFRIPELESVAQKILAQAKEAKDRILEEEVKKQENYQAFQKGIQKIPALLARLPKPFDSKEEPRIYEAFASGVFPDSQTALAVSGQIEQEDAAFLVRLLQTDAALTPLLNKLGHTLITVSEAKIEVFSEHAGELKARQDLLRFLRGYNTTVIISDLHLGGDSVNGDYFEKKVDDFLEIINWIKRHHAKLVLNGDTFNLIKHFEVPEPEKAIQRLEAVHRKYPSLFEALASLERLTFLPGNHDPLIASNQPVTARLKELLGQGKTFRPFYPHRKGARRFHLVHGDDMDPKVSANPDKPSLLAKTVIKPAINGLEKAAQVFSKNAALTLRRITKKVAPESLMKYLVQRPAERVYGIMEMYETYDASYGYSPLHGYYVTGHSHQLLDPDSGRVNRILKNLKAPGRWMNSGSWNRPLIPLSLFVSRETTAENKALFYFQEAGNDAKEWILIGPDGEPHIGRASILPFQNQADEVLGKVTWENNVTAYRSA